MSWQAQRERGAGWGIALLFWVARHLGQRLAVVVLVFPLLWFFITGAHARSAVRDYLARVQTEPVRLRDVWRQFWRFGRVAVDRIFLLMGSTRYQFDGSGHALVESTLERGGALLFVAHFGSFESMRVQGSRERHLPIAILMDRAHGAKITAALERVAPELAAHVIDAAEGGPALVLKLRETLAAGRLIGIMADRARAGEPTVAAQFMGSTAHFPANPFQLALALKCPVLLGFSTSHAAGQYQTHFELLTTGLNPPRSERQAALHSTVQAYAARLEHHVRQAPDNWFNFYHFWEIP